LRYPPPADAEWENRTPFTTLGVRIPALVISPWVEPRSVYKGLLDHTSILQLMVDRFGEPAGLAKFGHAGARKAAGIQSLADVLTRTSPRVDTLTSLPTPPSQAGPPVPGPPSETSKMFAAVVAAAPALHD
jgi:phospholipase C